MMKRGICLFLVIAFFCGACKRKDEVSYLDIRGDWYLFAVYKVGSNVDLLPTAGALGYGCVKDAVLYVNDTAYHIDSTCDFLDFKGTYNIVGASIAAVDDEGKPVEIYFDNGVLSTIQEIPVIGKADMRFQKK